MAAYATPQELADRYSFDEIRDLASDTESSVQNINDDPKILNALADASGRLEAAVLAGGQYRTEDLAALTGNTLGFLKRIVCEMAFCFLIQTRPGSYGEEARKQMMESSEMWLEMLRTGKNIFNLTAVKDATKIDVDGPDVTTYQRLNMIPDRTRNYYPSRGSRLPMGRGG